MVYTKEQQEQVIRDRKRAKELINNFMYMRNMAELKALSNYSLEQPLTDSQFKRMMELKGVLGL